MSLRRLLEEFPEPSAMRASPEDSLQQDIENARVKGYEEGYASGWADAIADERKRRGKVDAEFERCIQDLGFTYHEAVSQVRSELVVFLTELINAVFPATIPDIARETIRAEVTDLADGALNPHVKLLASEAMHAALQDIMPEAPLDVSLEIEPSLGPNQAYLTLAGQERVIDFQPLIDTIRAQLDAVVKESMPEVKDG